MVEIGKWNGSGTIPVTIKELDWSKSELAFCQ
jgi:hypothetical protein